MAVRGRIAAVPLGAAASLRGSFRIDVVIRDTTPPRTDRSVDRAAVDAILGGQTDGYRVLIEREAASVIRACYRILGDPHEAEDAAQEAFVIAYRSLASWRGDGAFGAWLSTIAVRVALRQAGRRRAVTWVDPVTQADDVSNDQGADPATLALRAEHSADLRTAVARLDEPYRETIALRFFAERSLAEIAAETGRPLGTVKTHLHRGLLRLRDAMGEREGDR